VRNYSDLKHLNHYDNYQIAATKRELLFFDRKAVINALLEADADWLSGLLLPVPVKAALATAACKLKKKPKRKP